MYRVLAAVLLVGCDSGGTTSPDGSLGNGHITHDTTWSGTTTITTTTRIDPGVTVTAQAGATIQVAGNATLKIDGTLAIQGTSTAKVTIEPEGTAQSFGGLELSTSGQLTMH